MRKIISICVLLGLLGLLSGCAAVVVGTAATSAVVAQDRRTAGTIVEDNSIELKAINAIARMSKDDPEVHVNSISYNNRVLLVGQAPTRQMREKIEKAVRKIEKVQQVYNEITLSEPTPMATRSKDTWITTRIKSEIALTKDINAGHVKVVTENGIVYVMGIVNELEDEIAVDIARHVQGVTKVVKMFEYVKN